MFEKDRYYVMVLQAGWSFVGLPILNKDFSITLKDAHNVQRHDGGGGLWADLAELNSVTLDLYGEIHFRDPILSSPLPEGWTPR